MQRGALAPPLAKGRELDASGVLDVNHLRSACFSSRQGELKRSASYTLLPAFFRAAAAAVGLLCGGCGVVVMRGA